MLKRFTNWIKDIFTPIKSITTDTPTNKDVTAPDTVTNKIERLKAHHVKLKQGYGANIEKLKQTYDEKQAEYADAYQEVQHKITSENLSMPEIKEERATIQPYEDSLRDIGTELRTVQGYLQDESMQVVQSIESMQDEFTTELADNIGVNVTRLKRIRKEYLQAISDIGSDYRTAKELEKFMVQEHSIQGIPYKSTLTKILEGKTDNLPMQVQELTITQVTVNDAFKGSLPTTKQYQQQ